jgi:hypothetical protein
LHVDENGLAQLKLLETAGNYDKALAAKQAAEYQSDIGKYQQRSRETMAKAKALEEEYEKLGFKDDQFDMSEAFIAIAIAVAAVATLVESYALLVFAWGSGAIGIVFGLAAFLGWGIRLEWLVKLLT